MEGELHDLLRILDAEYDVFVKCLEKLTEQQRFLIDNDRGGFMVYQQKLTLLAREAADLEAERNSIIKTISAKLNLGPADKPVRELLESLNGPGFRRFSELKRTVIDAYDKSESQRRRNDSLIRQSMEIIRKTTDHARRTDEPGAIDKLQPGTRNSAISDYYFEAFEPSMAKASREEESIRGRTGV